MHRRSLRPLLPAAALALGLAAVGLAGPAVALTQSPTTCLTECTAVFVPSDGTTTFTVPASVTSLAVTVNGGAGDQATTAGPLATSSIGGPGGSTTVDLNPGSAGSTYDLTVGGTGQASSVSLGGALVAVAGGGGGGGYIGRLDLPDQIFGTYPGGAGGSPSTPGVVAGGDGTTPNGTTENGGGGPDAGGGAAGTGATANGAPGLAPTTTSIVAGGAGGTVTVLVANDAGNGGSGYSGGGGGGITRNLLDGDGNPFDVVGAGGGGSGYLAAGFTAAAGAPNTSTGSVTFTYSFSPTITTTATTVQADDSVPTVVAGLPAGVPFTLVFDGATVASGTSDPSGTATASFVIASGQATGAFPVQLVVGGTVATSTPPVTVTRPALASTGAPVSGWVVGGAVALVLIGALLLIVFRRRAARH